MDRWDFDSAASHEPTRRDAQNDAQKNALCGETLDQRKEYAGFRRRKEYANFGRKKYADVSRKKYAIARRKEYAGFWREKYALCGKKKLEKLTFVENKFVKENKNKKTVSS